MESCWLIARMLSVYYGSVYFMPAAFLNIASIMASVFIICWCMLDYALDVLAGASIFANSRNRHRLTHASMCQQIC